MAEFYLRIAEQAGGNHGAPFPLEPRKFQGAYVTFAGIKKKLRKNLAQIVGTLGGEPQKSATELTTHIIAHKLTSKTYSEACANHIPILKPEFIFAVRDAPGDVDVRSADFISTYSLKTFENVLVCVSECPEEVQVEIQNAIVDGGGHFSRNLQKNKTDVVIIPAAIGEEFEVARQWKIPTVTPDWVFSSEAGGRLLSLNRFQPRLQPALSSLMKTAEISRSLFIGLSFLVQLESESESRRISELIKANGGDILLDIGQVEHGTIAILPPVYSGRLPKGILESFTKYWVEEVCQQKCLVDFELSFHHKSIQVDENSAKLLSGFSVFITGYSEAMKDYLGVLVTHLGASTQESLNVKSEPGRQRINYVISNDMNYKSVDIARNSEIPIVKEDWIVACCEQNALLDYGNFLLLSENASSIDESCSTSVTTPESSRRKRTSSPLQDASTWINHSTSGTIIPGTPESVSLFSPRRMCDLTTNTESVEFCTWPSLTSSYEFM